MKEQSDTPRQTPLVELLLAVPEDARLIYEHSPTESQSIPVGPMCRQAAMELATATRERDEARAIANDRDAMVDHRDRALTAMYQRVDVITQERDEARAEVERLRSTFVHCHVRGSSGDLCAVCGLDLRDKVHTAATEAARKFCGVGELERAGYIPAGSADERET